MATLQVLESSDARLQGQSIPLAGALCRIGRDPSANISIADTSVSRRHASLSMTGQGWVIADESSGNGVYVNQQRVSRHELKTGDVIVIGGTTFRFEDSVENLPTVATELPPALRPQTPNEAPPPVPPPYAPPAAPPAYPAYVQPPPKRASGCAVGCLIASILLLLGTTAASLYLLHSGGYLADLLK